jgi:predicted transcriptional regulator
LAKQEQWCILATQKKLTIDQFFEMLLYFTKNLFMPGKDAVVRMNKQLGELEIATLETLWRDGAHSAKSLHRLLESERKIDISTAQSTLERLCRKGILSRYKQSHAYIYECKVSRRELLGELITDVISQLSGGELEPILSSFIDYAERIDNHTLDELEELIKQRRQAGGAL